MDTISVSENGLVEMMNIFNINLTDDVYEDAVFKTAGDLEETATANINERIYMQPPSPNYRRTGRALRSRLNTSISKTSRRVVNDTRIQGASHDYNRALNKNKNIARFNTNYWDDAVDYAQENAPKNLKESLNKATKGHIK